MDLGGQSGRHRVEQIKQSCIVWENKEHAREVLQGMGALWPSSYRGSTEISLTFPPKPVKREPCSEKWARSWSIFTGKKNNEVQQKAHQELRNVLQAWPLADGENYIYDSSQIFMPSFRNQMTQVHAKWFVKNTHHYTNRKYYLNRIDQYIDTREQVRSSRQINNRHDWVSLSLHFMICISYF